MGTEEAAINAVCDNVEVEIPSGMINNEIDNMMKDVETRLSYQGLNLKQYLQMVGKSEEDMRKEFEEQAKVSVKSRLVLDAIVKAEKIEASEEEIEEKIKEMAENYGRNADELKNIIWEKIKEINRTFPRYKYVKNIIITDEELIKTTTKKIKRHEEMKKIITKK